MSIGSVWNIWLVASVAGEVSLILRSELRRRVMVRRGECGFMLWGDGCGEWGVDDWNCREMGM